MQVFPLSCDSEADRIQATSNAASYAEEAVMLLFLEKSRTTQEAALFPLRVHVCDACGGD